MNRKTTRNIAQQVIRLIIHTPLIVRLTSNVRSRDSCLVIRKIQRPEWRLRRSIRFRERKIRFPSGPAKRDESRMFGPAGDTVGKNTPDLSGCQAQNEPPGNYSVTGGKEILTGISSLKEKTGLSPALFGRSSTRSTQKTEENTSSPQRGGRRGKRFALSAKRRPSKRSLTEKTRGRK
jgi:hypothetical protein